MSAEVSIAKGVAARTPIARDVEGEELLAHIQSALQVGAVWVMRSDWTPEARRAKWEEDFYDIDRAGRRRRRFKRPQIEKEWEAWAKEERKLARAQRALDKAGDHECAECGDKWYRLTPDYLQHRCGEGLVDIRKERE